jgi:LEA14-like dessication related protein
MARFLLARWAVGKVRLLSVVAVALLVTGCALFGLRRPVIDLVDVRLGQVGLLETTVLVDLRIHNDNPVGLTIEDGLYELFVEGVLVGRGRLSQLPVTVPRYGTREQQIALHIDNLRLLRQVRSVLTTGSFDYRLEAQHFMRGFGRRPFTSVREGTLGSGEIRLDSGEIR